MSEAARAPRPIYVFEKGENHGTRFEFRGSTRIVELTGTSTDGPLVSCIMITRGDPKLVATSVEAFAAQTYANKELVIVCDDVTDALRGLVARRADVRLIAIDEVLPLGTLRNEGTRAARGDILCQWDDDDLFSPQRLEAGVSALLRAGTRALFLLRWMIWWPKRKFFGVSAERLCEGSMFVWKDAMGVYPALRRCEDTQMVEALCRAHDFALLDDPASYCYVIHGGNTWDEDHMSTMIERCSLVFEHDHELQNSRRFSACADMRLSTTAPRRRRKSIRGSMCASLKIAGRGKRRAASTSPKGFFWIGWASGSAARRA